MKRFYLFICFTLLLVGEALAQTNPTAQAIPYSQNFSTLSGAYLAGWQGWKIGSSIPSTYSTSAPSADVGVTVGNAGGSYTAATAYDYSGKMGFLPVGSNNITIVLAVNTTAYTGTGGIVVTYDAMTIRNPYATGTNDYIEALGCQYRIGTTGTFTTLTTTPGYQNNTTNQTTAVTTGQNIVTGITATLPAACNNKAVVQIRWTVQTTSGTTGSRPSFAIDNVSVTLPTCTSPDVLAFVSQPTDIAQSGTMSPVTVKAYCSATGVTASSYTGAITLTAVNGGCGYVSQTVNAVSGVATFSNIVFSRGTQSGIQLQASASGFTAVPSNTFNILAAVGGGTTNTTIVANNFDGTSTWGYVIGTPTYSGTGGTGGGDNVTTTKLFGGNHALVKSYTADNASKEIRSTNTVTFTNQTGLAAYTYVTLNFQVGSLTVAAGTGAGVDNKDNMNIDVSYDGGTTWSTILYYYGNNDYLFPLSATSPVSLTSNTTSYYQTPSTQSAFSLTLPTGTTQFTFRMVATDNRTNENWAIDNITLVGTTIPTGAPKPLPTASGYSISTCPNTNNTISVATANTVGAVAYAWTPATYISNAAISNPVVNPPASATYNCTITDADNCTSTAAVTITTPAGTAGSWTGVTSNDWFQCTNWGDGVVPTSSTNVTIPTSPTNSAVIDPLSSFSTPFSGIAYANNLANNQTLTLQSGAYLNVAGNITNATTGLIDMTAGGIIELKGNWINNRLASGFTAGIGKVIFSGSGAQSITPAALSETFYDLTINNSGTGAVTMNKDVTVTDITALTAGTLKINDKTLTLNGAVTNGTGSLTGSNASNLTIGAAAGTLNFTVSSDTTQRTLKNLSLNAGSSATLGTELYIAAGSSAGSVTVVNTGILNTNNLLTLRSDYYGTSRVGQNTSNTTYINGNVSIERYIQGFRAWRLLTAPITTSQTISASWQEGQYNSISTPPLSDTHFGYGTQITNNLATVVSGAGATGFDKAVTNNPSILYLNNGTSWTAPANTNNTYVNSQPGFMLFVRGSRSVEVTPPTFKPATATTLRTKGGLNQGDKTVNCSPCTATPATPQFAAVGNPYASEVTLDNIFGLYNTTVVGNYYYAWDPTLSKGLGVGAFVTIGYNAAGDYDHTSVPAGSLLVPGKIESGQAFVFRFGGTGNAKFQEVDKTMASPLVFRPVDNATKQSFRADLYIKYDNGITDLADGTLTLYNNQYSNDVSWLEDANKLGNPAENISLQRGGKLLGIERRAPIKTTDTIFLRINNMRQQNYQFQFAAGNLARPGLHATLEDSYLNASTAVSLTDTAKIDFAVTADAASQGNNRFRIVFQTIDAAPLPVTFTNIKALLQTNNIAVQWNVANEINITSYEVEKSTDGVTFVKVATVKAAGSASVEYNWLDVQASTGINYYRICSIGNNGAVQYSEVVKVKIGAGSPMIAVYPNPIVKGILGLKFSNMPKGTYNLRLLNLSSQQLMKQSVKVATASDLKKISLSRSLSKGIYQLEIVCPGNTTTILKVLND